MYYIVIYNNLHAAAVLFTYTDVDSTFTVQLHARPPTSTDIDVGEWAQLRIYNILIIILIYCVCKKSTQLSVKN